ncbi:MAG: Crp/Fnr family transcriptional regulator [Eubacteriales bacterium]
MKECDCCGMQYKQGLCVQKVSIFSALNYDDLIKISELVTHREYQKGDVLLREGEKPGCVFIMNEGSVKAFHYTQDGREQILYVFAEGDFFGEQYLMGDKAAAYHVEALEKVKICILSKTDFHSILSTFPDIAIKIIETLDDRLARMEQSLQSMGVRSVDARVASLLLSYADAYGSPDKEGVLVRLPLSREGMANYLGIARETVSRKLSQMENEHLIRSISNKSMLVLDRAALVNISGLSK